MNNFIKKMYGFTKILAMVTVLGLGAIAFSPREAVANVSFDVVAEEKNL